MYFRDVEFESRADMADLQLAMAIMSIALVIMIWELALALTVNGAVRIHEYKLRDLEKGLVRTGKYAADIHIKTE